MSSDLLKEWIRKAEQDYEAAVFLAKKRNKTTPDAVCFHAQQCAEKYLKTFLVKHDKRFPKTHDLLDLLTLCAEIDSTFELIHDLLDRLNAYAVEFRYPGEEATRREFLRATEAVKEVRAFVRSKL